MSPQTHRTRTSITTRNIDSARRIRYRRSGTTAVEFAIACPVVFSLIFASIVGALGTFRYQHIAALAREGARWASVHGGQYALDTGKTAATANDIYTNAIQPGIVGLDPSRLSYQITWNQSNMPQSATTSYSTPKGNTVSVTLTYQWVPELILTGPIALTSTATAQMAY